ncbi:hypothetical protein Tco_1021027 [Tanacetum coccineum]
MGTIDSMNSILTQFALDALCEKFHIPDTVHPELPGPNDRIRNSPTKMDLFAFIHHVDPTKVQIGEREVREGEVLLLQLTRDRVVLLAGVNDQGNQNEVVQDEFVHVVNEKSGDAAVVDQVGQSDHVVHVRGIDIVGDDEVQSIVADKPKRVRKKRKVADGAGGSGLPPKKLKEDHGTSGISASTGRKSVVVLQSLLEGSTLPVEVSVTTVATLPFITSSMSLTPEHDEVTSIVRSSVPPPLVLTAAVATTIIADATFAPAPRAGTKPVPRSIFRDSASTSEANQDFAGPSYPAGTKFSKNSFFMSQDVDSETLLQTYIPKWNVTNDSALNDPDICRGVIDHLVPHVLFSQLRSMDYEQLFVEFNVRVAHQICLSSEVRVRLEHELRGRKKFEGKCAMQADWLKEKDAIRLRGQVATVEAAKAARANELNVLKEQNSALEEEKCTLEIKVAALEFADATKVAELASLTAQVAKLTKDLSELGLSYNELSVKASSFKVEKDRLSGQVSSLEGICYRLRDEVMGYKLFKEQIEAVQDEQVKVLSDKVAGLDADLMGMALHLDEEFYPCYLTTIAGRKWILSRGLRLVVMKCLQSPEYLAALGGAIGHAVDKGMQGGLAAGIDHGKAGRGLADVAAYNHSTKANYIFAVNSLQGPAADTLDASQLQPLPEQLMLPIHRLEDQVVIGETSLYFSLDVAHARVQRLRGNAVSRHTSGVLATATTTAPSTTFIQASTVPPILVADHGASGAGPSTGVPSPSKIVFEKEELETTPEHTTTS